MSTLLVDSRSYSLGKNPTSWANSTFWAEPELPDQMLLFHILGCLSTGTNSPSSRMRYLPSSPRPSFASKVDPFLRQIDLPNNRTGPPEARCRSKALSRCCSIGG